MGYKEETQSAYDRHAKAFEERTKDYNRSYIQEEVNLFLENLKGKKILDLGSGPGRDASVFKEKGYSPVCVDNSLAMVDLCKEKGLLAYQMDMEDLTFPAASFDGVWSYASLHHIPKQTLPSVLKKIKKILSEEGIFFVALKEGDGEGFRQDSLYPGSKRFFALYQEEELKKILEEYFEIIHKSRKEFPPKTYLHFLCKVKP